MHFSMWLWPYGRWGGFDGIGRAAQRIEELGFESITVSDHTVCPTGPEGDGLMPDWPDWAVTSAYLATITTKLRIVACVAVPYRSPLVTAKQLATIDDLSHGRLTLAACVGWWEREFDMLNVSYARRGAVMDEYLDAMRTLWTEEQPRFRGEFVSFSDLRFEPRCSQRPHVPIWIAGGAGRRSLERLWRVGDGWMPMGEDRPAQLGETIARIKDGAAQRGRDPEKLSFRYTIGVGEAEPALGLLSSAIASAKGGIVSDEPSSTVNFDGNADSVVESIHRYAEAGFTELAINPSGRSYAACMERMEWFAAEVLPQLGSLGDGSRESRVKFVDRLAVDG